MQIVGREQAAVLVEVVHGRLVGRSRRPHARGRRQQVGLLEVAVRAGGDHVLPSCVTAFRAGHDVVERQVFPLAAILAGEAVAQEHIEPGERGIARRFDIALERHDRGQPHLEARAADARVVFRQDVDPVEEDGLDRILPAPDRQRVIAQRAEVRVQDEGRTILRRDWPHMNGHKRRSVAQPESRSDCPILYRERDGLVKAPKSGPFRGFVA